MLTWAHLLGILGVPRKEPNKIHIPQHSDLKQPLAPLSSLTKKVKEHGVYQDPKTSNKSNDPQ